MRNTSYGKNPLPILSYASHKHPDWEIVLQLSGHVTTTVHDHTFLLNQGDILVTPPGLYHSGVSDVPFTNIFFRFDDLDFSHSFTVHDTDSGVLHLMNLLYKVLCEKEYNYAPLADSLTDAILQYIKKYQGETNKHPAVAGLQNTIYNNIDNPDFDLTAAIRKTGFCPDYLRRCFKEDTGKTPLEYQTHLRLSLARTLLVEDNFTGIANIALRCGFKDSFYFATCFRKNTGITPSEYRKKNYRN